MKTIETKTVANVNEIVDIINKLNYKGETFEYENTSTFYDNSKGRFFGSVRKNGNPGGFSILEFVVDDELKAVRFFNHYKDITVEFKLGDFAPSYDRFDNVIEIPADQPANITAAETDGSEDDAEDDNPFSFLPALDELNDINDVAPVIQPLRQEFYFTAEGDEFCKILAGDVVTYLNGEFNHVSSTKYAAWYSPYFGHYGWHIFKDGKIFGVGCTRDVNEFFAEMERRGACSFDTPDLPPAAETDSSEDDIDDEDPFGLLPALDELNDVEIGEPTSNRNFLVDICVENTDNGNRVLKSKFWATARAAANWILGYANNSRKIARGTIHDWRKPNAVYNLTDIDIKIANGEPIDDTPDLPPSVDNNGYIFTVYCNDIRRVEARDTKCAILGDDNHFDNSVFREVTFYNTDNLGWELKTANGDIIIKGNDAPDFAKILAAVKTPAADNSFEKTFAAEFDNNGNCHVELNGEHVHIQNGRLSYVKAPRYNLAFDPDKKRFTYLGRVIAKSKVATIIKNKNTAADQRDKLREFFRPYIHNTGAFEYLISIDYCDDSDSNFGARFDSYEQAYDFAKHVDIMLKKFAGVKSFVRIRIDSNRELIYERDFDGNKFWALSAESANYLAADNPNLPAPVFTADIDDDNRTFIGQDGTRFIVTGDTVNISTKGTELTINGRPVANYRTIKAALAAADYVYYFAKEIYDDNYLPEFDYDPDEPDTVFDNRNKRDRSKQTIYLDPPQSLVEVATRINKFNHDAPHGWEIIFDAENKLFAVEFTGEHVANLDSLALMNILTPEEFFAQYAPLVNHGHEQNQFISEREAEIAQLQAMKADLGNDAERLKILDDLIADNQKEISATINAG